VAQVLGALTSVHAIMDTRTPQGAIAWAVSLNAMPYVAVPAYWVFGRSKFSGYSTARRAHYSHMPVLAQDLAAEFRQFRMSADPGAEQSKVLEKLARLPFTGANKVELLIDGEPTYESLFAAIAEAKAYVLVQSYIIEADATGVRLRDALLERAAQGVHCFVLYDELGSKLPDWYLNQLRGGGVQIQPFNTTKGAANRFQYNFRNHRKISIVDGRVGFVGGLNLCDDCLGKNPKYTPWRDTHVKVLGPVVQSLQVAWMEDWYWATQQVPEALEWKPASASGADQVALSLATGPADEFETATLFFLNAIHQSKKRLWIASPYFVPDEQVVSALQLAALRGVDVRILIPENPDHALVRLSAYSYLPEMERAGIKVFRHQPGFMHQKVFLIDDHYAGVSTANFDNRSFRLNFEVTLLVFDTAFTKQVETMLEHDFAQSKQAFAKELTEATFFFRLKVRVARLLAPIQ